MGCLIKVWDLPSGKLIDCFKFDNAPTSLSFSPTPEFLATTHVNELGIFLWSNKTLYSHVPLKQLSDDYEPVNAIEMPHTNTLTTSSDSQQEEASVDIYENDDINDYKNYTSPEQLALELVTLSLLPESRWKNLVYLDIIKVIGCLILNSSIISKGFFFK
jgi:U3 small nucleolar RNA-associated protein 21